MVIVSYQLHAYSSSFNSPLDSLRAQIITCSPKERPELYLELVSKIRSDSNNGDSIIHYLEQAHIAADIVSDHKNKVESLRLLASQHGKRKEYKIAEQYFEEGISVAREKNYDEGLADLHYTKALFHYSKAEHEGFVSNILEAIELYDGLKEWNKKGKSLISLGVQYAGIKEIDLAIEKLNEAKKLESHFTPNVQLYLNLHLGKNYRRKAVMENEDSLMLQAIEILEEGKSNAKKLSNKAREGEFCLALLDSYSLLNPPSYRYSLAQRTIDIGSQTNDNFLEYQGYLGMSQMLVSEGKFNQAYGLRSPMKESLDQLSNPVYKRSYNEINYEISKGLGRNSEALSFLERFKTLNDSILDVERTSQFNEIVEKYENEKKEKEIIKLNEEKEKLTVKDELNQSLIRERNLWLGGLSILGISGIFLVYFVQKQKRTEAEKRSLQVEQQLLRAQMNPHFIFNSLNGIKRFYIEGRTEDANDFLADFSTLLRTILDRSDKTEVSVEGEVDFLRLYLELEKRRLNDKLNYEINFDPESFEYDDIIPSFIVQPLVENAIWHGLSKKDGMGKIMINFRKNREDVIIEVVDNGIGLNGTRTSNGLHKSKGLNLIRERLGNKGTLELNDLSENNKESIGTMATLKIQLN